VVSFPHVSPPKPCTHLFSTPICATCPAHLNLLNMIIRTTLNEAYRLLRSSLCSFLNSPVTSSLLGPNFSSKLYSQAVQNFYMFHFKEFWRWRILIQVNILDIFPHLGLYNPSQLRRMDPCASWCEKFRRRTYSRNPFATENGNRFVHRNILAWRNRHCPTYQPRLLQSFT